MSVLDASAVLAFISGEQGADRVEDELFEAILGAANWAEVLQKVRARGGDPVIVRALLLGYGVQIEDVSATDAERAAAMWRRGSGLSLGDRLCLALAERLQMPVLTADRAWGSSKQVIQIR